MSFIERALRVLTHVNIGASLGVAAWLLFGSVDLVTARPALHHGPVQRVQPLDSRTCGCTTHIALAASTR